MVGATGFEPSDGAHAPRRKDRLRAARPSLMPPAFERYSGFAQSKTLIKPTN